MRRRALVIDDEKIVLTSISKILKEKNFDVDTAESGRQGIELALKNDYDIVLTDIRMPDIGGMRVLRDIKRAKPSLPVIMITGYATIKGAVQAMKLGAQDYLEKPFTPEELMEAISSALDMASTIPVEEQTFANRDEVLKLLERAADDPDFAAKLLYHGVEAMEGYKLTQAEKLAILTGDIEWIEKHVGKLTDKQKKWFEHKQSAEIW